MWVQFEAEFGAFSLPEVAAKAEGPGKSKKNLFFFLQLFSPVLRAEHGDGSLSGFGDRNIAESLCDITFDFTSGAEADSLPAAFAGTRC